jgi:hypothetical protein
MNTKHVINEQDIVIEMSIYMFYINLQQNEALGWYEKQHRCKEE